jgi:hypothetical protein
MKKKLLISLILGLIGGWGIVFWLSESQTAAFWGAMFGAFICVGSDLTELGHEKEKKQACADVRKEIYDQLVDNGGTASINGKQWKKGCRIDPESFVVIEPEV